MVDMDRSRAETLIRLLLMENGEFFGSGAGVATKAFYSRKLRRKLFGERFA